MNRPPPPEIVVAGYLGVDLTPGFPPGRPAVPFPGLFRPGSLVEVSGLQVALGGAVANTGLALKTFGRRVALSGLIGADWLGDFVERRLAAEGLAAGLRRSPAAGTGYGLVLAPPGSDRMFFEDPGCNARFGAECVDFEALAGCRIFHFGYPTLMERMYRDGGRELRELLSAARAHGAATSLDMTLPDPSSAAGRADWAAILDAVLPMTDLFLPSLEELIFLMTPDRYARLLAEAGGGDVLDSVPRDWVEELGARILAKGVAVLMIKAGHRGAYLRTGDVGRLAPSLGLSAADWTRRALWVPAFPADPARIRNACGAGDCAVAGFLAAMVQGEPLARAGRFAMLAGRDNLYGSDSQSGLRSWEAMAGELAASSSEAG